ncbi:probable disease resistance protein At4g33300 [Prosopis cineraria]|uniref:probable disease resistance protein At4g33300 n=1 Tax=Prosopis cineraria TaxID=364024 RepID=UPI00240EC0BA|nr:probable disease resistance protein At4g33300 [Prosopis cineraria]
MAVTDFFAGEIATELMKLLVDISRKSLLCKSSADQLHNYINQLLPIIEEIKYSGVELSAVRQSQLDRISEMLRSGVELSHKVLSSSRWNVYKNLQLAKKMEKLEKNVSRFLKGPMQAHILADVHHTRFEMAERFDRLEASNRRLEQYFGAIKIGVGGGGWVEQAVRSMEEDERVDGNSGSFRIGLDLGKKKVKELVVGRQDLPVVGIRGIGGSGKTTLAREIYRDDHVRCYFQRILFLTVSQSPNVELLRAKIWGFIMGNEHLNPNHVTPQRKPQFECRTETRILIVLDDVWSLSVLEQLVWRIPGCKFLVVSRFNFPTFFSASYEVELLSEEDALSLFCHHAFGQKSIPLAANGNLVKQVVTECGRLPLALKVIGASLRDQSEMFWAGVKNRLSQGQSIGESYEINLIERMAISINYLPVKIKDCFLDLCSFPEDKKIPLEVLVNMWVEIHDIDETEAFAIVVELSNKNLLTLVQEARSGGMYSSCFEIYVTQHDVLRDVALNLSSRESINERRRLVMPKRVNGVPKEWSRYKDRPFEAQIVSIHTGEMKEADWFRMEFPKAEVLIINFSSSEFFLPPFIDRMPNLRALILINYSASYASIHNFRVFENLAPLRSLWLEKVSIPQFSDFPLVSLRKLFVVLCKINDNVDGGMTDLSKVFPNLSELTLDHCDNLTELPPSICKMESLQNLSLTNCHNLVKLPDELGKLRSLEILRLYACPALETLPPSIGQLIRLKYIDISQCVNLGRIPVEIGKLVNLEKMDMRECSSIRVLPKSATSLKSLRLVICDDEVSGMWRDVEKARPDVCIQVSEQSYDLDWLNEK